MNITVTTETPEVGKLVATLTISKKDVEAAISASYREIASEVAFQGFRRGRAPRPVIDGIVGRQRVMADATSRLLSEAASQMIDELDIVPLSKVDFGQNPDLVKDKTEYTVTVNLDVAPVVELDSYEAPAIEMPTADATEADIEYQINRLRSYRTTYEDVEEDRGAEAGDMVLADVKNIANLREYEGENRMFSLDNQMLHEEFREGLTGMKVGEEKEIRWTRTHTHDDETREVDFAATVKVNALRVRVVPEITEENVKTDYGFDSVEELREALKAEIATEKAATLPQYKEDRIVEAIGERVTMDIPDLYVEEVYRENMTQFSATLQRQGISMEQFLNSQDDKGKQYLADLREQSVDRARQSLALDAFARHLGFGATDEEIENEFAGAGIPDWQKQLADYRAGGHLPAVREAIRRRKALEWLTEHAEVTIVDVDDIAEADAAEDEE